MLIAAISGIAILAVWRPCTRAAHRCQRPSLWLSVFGGLVAALIMVGVFEGNSLLTGEFGIREWWLLRASVSFLFSFLVGAVASLIVIATYRRRHLT